MSVSASLSAPLRIDVWMDFCCPACYLAEPRLEEAVEAEGGATRIAVVRHSYELLPDVDDTVVDAFGYILHKFGGNQAQAEQQEQRMADLARAQGRDYLPHRPSANSFDAHRFLHLAHAHGKADSFFAQVQQDLFAKATNIYDTAYLIQAATRLGIPAEAIHETATTDAYAEAVRADRGMAREAGATGVPYAVFGNRLAVPGVVTVEDYRNAIQQARRDSEGEHTNSPSQPFTVLDVPHDAFCDPDTGVCAVRLPATEPSSGESATARQ